MGKGKRKRKPETLCVYCGVMAVCTDEHVIPKCLFPKVSLPSKSEFMIIPVCRPCNASKAKDDSYIRDWFAIHSLSNDNSNVQAMRRTAFRSYMKNWSDLLRTLLPKGPTVDGLQTIRVVLASRFDLAISPEEKQILRFFKMLTRGLSWKVFEERLPNDCCFDIIRHDEQTFQESRRYLLDIGGKGPYFIGEGIFNYVCYANKNIGASLWSMCFFENVYIRVEAGPKHFFECLEELAKAGASSRAPG